MGHAAILGWETVATAHDLLSDDEVRRTIEGQTTMDITTQPANQTAIVGQAATFSVTATGPGT